MPEFFFDVAEFTANTAKKSKPKTKRVRTAVSRVSRNSCDGCKLQQGISSPKMEPYGEGRMNILVVGEAPGKQEDKKGRQFVGRAGEMFRKTARSLGLDIDIDCVLTNVVQCRPPANCTKYPYL